MRYSYAWRVECAVLLRAHGTETEGRLRNAYVSVPGPNAPLALHEGGDLQAGLLAVSLEEREGGAMVLALVRGKPDWRNMSVLPVPSGPFRGRVSFDDFGGAVVDITASRLHGASIAGLVVGAMGVFVFTVALRHWLRERRRFREEAGA